jgi:hypothetical protein
MRPALWLTLAAAFAVSSCVSKVLHRGVLPSRDIGLRCVDIDDEEWCPLHRVTIAQILDRPNYYHGERVELRGYVHREFESSGFYASKEEFKARYAPFDPEKRVATNISLWISFSRDTNGLGRCQDQYVLVRGIFDGAEHGHRSAWAGGVVEVTVCNPLEENVVQPNISLQADRER